MPKYKCYRRAINVLGLATLRQGANYCETPNELFISNGWDRDMAIIARLRHHF